MDVDDDWTASAGIPRMVVYEGVVCLEILVCDRVDGGWLWRECDGGNWCGAGGEGLVGAVEKAGAGHGGRLAGGGGVFERVEG